MDEEHIKWLVREAISVERHRIVERIREIIGGDKTSVEQDDTLALIADAIADE